MYRLGFSPNKRHFLVSKMSTQGLAADSEPSDAGGKGRF
jgi:hypothetical protein